MTALHPWPEMRGLLEPHRKKDMALAVQAIPPAIEAHSPRRKSQMTESRILQAPADVMDYVDQIRELADGNRASLGFLPASAYTEAAMKGHLWIAIDKSTKRLRGHLLLGGRYPHLKVFQVHVLPEYRSEGVGAKLVGELKEYGEDSSWLTIRSRVASNLEANKFWQGCGFRIVRQIPRRSNRTINLYEFELDVPSLFGRRQFLKASGGDDGGQIAYARPLLETPSYVIDLNVFFDSVRQRDAGESAFIFSSALNGEIRVRVTPEFRKELERRSSDVSDDPVLEFARTLPTLPEVPSRILAHLIEDLKDTLSIANTRTGKWAANEQSDLVHLASCIHHKALGFVTRDARILRHTGTLLEKYKLRIISPHDLSESFGEVDTYQPEFSVAVGKEKIKVASLDEGLDAGVESFLREMGIDEADISCCLAAGTKQSPRIRLVVRTGEGIVGIGSWEARVSSSPNAIAYLYVDEENWNADRAMDHLLESMTNRGHLGQLFAFDLRLGQGQRRTRELAIRRGFQPIRGEEGDAPQILRKVSHRGAITNDDWKSFRKDFNEATGVELAQSMPKHDELTNTGIVLNSKVGPITRSHFDFETLVSPGSIICPGRSGVIVPIRETYARELLPFIDGQASLLPGKEAALRLERAYFCGVGMQKVVGRGTALVFYVSGRKKAAVALARATFCDKLTSTQAVLNLERQGVLSEEEIGALANPNSELTAMTFDNLLRFRRGISYGELKQMGCVGGANLVTAQRLSPEALLRIVARGMD